MKKNTYNRNKKIIKRGKCPFCVSKKTPDYKEPEILKAYITERGKILSKDRTAVCFKHQKKLTVAIKRARHLSLLQFSTQV